MLAKVKQSVQSMEVNYQTIKTQTQCKGRLHTLQIKTIKTLTQYKGRLHTVETLTQ